MSTHQYVDNENILLIPACVRLKIACPDNTDILPLQSIDYCLQVAGIDGQAIDKVSSDPFMMLVPPKEQFLSRGWKTVFRWAKERGPLIRIMPIPPDPGGVEMAAMVSLLSMVLSKFKFDKFVKT